MWSKHAPRHTRQIYKIPLFTAGRLDVVLRRTVLHLVARVLLLLMKSTLGITESVLIRKPLPLKPLENRMRMTNRNPFLIYLVAVVGQEATSLAHLVPFQGDRRPPHRSAVHPVLCLDLQVSTPRRTVHPKGTDFLLIVVLRNRKAAPEELFAYLMFLPQVRTANLMLTLHVILPNVAPLGSAGATQRSQQNLWTMNLRRSV